MKTKEFIQHTMIYLFTPENSSEVNNTTRPGSSPQLWPASLTWLGAIKTIMWASVAIVLPLVLINLSF